MNKKLNCERFGKWEHILESQTPPNPDIIQRLTSGLLTYSLNIWNRRTFLHLIWVTTCFYKLCTPRLNPELIYGEQLPRSKVKRMGRSESFLVCPADMNELRSWGQSSRRRFGDIVKNFNVSVPFTTEEMNLLVWSYHSTDSYIPLVVSSKTAHTCALCFRRCLIIWCIDAFRCLSDRVWHPAFKVKSFSLFVESGGKHLDRFNITHKFEINCTRPAVTVRCFWYRALTHTQNKKICERRWHASSEKLPTTVWPSFSVNAPRLRASQQTSSGLRVVCLNINYSTWVKAPKHLHVSSRRQKNINTQYLNTRWQIFFPLKE